MAAEEPNTLQLTPSVEYQQMCSRGNECWGWGQSGCCLDDKPGYDCFSWGNLCPLAPREPRVYSMWDSQPGAIPPLQTYSMSYFYLRPVPIRIEDLPNHIPKLKRTTRDTSWSVINDPSYVIKNEILCRVPNYPVEINEWNEWFGGFMNKIQYFDGYARRDLPSSSIHNDCSWKTVEWKLHRKTGNTKQTIKSKEYRENELDGRDQYTPPPSWEIKVNGVDFAIIRSWATPMIMACVARLVVLARRARIRVGRRNLSTLLRATRCKGPLCQLAGTINTPVKARIAEYLTGDNYKKVLG